MLMDALAQIEASGLMRGLRTSFAVYPLVSAAHIAGFATMFGAIITYDLSVLRGSWRGLSDPARRIAAVGAVVAITTGLILFLARGTSYAANPAFQIKALLLTLALANVARAHLDQRPDTARATALASIILWTGVLIAGRYIAFL
ncbi:MAG: hypothetical protein Q4G22_11175 [Paracoccus sp. (in: a-proteobacteria)]|uniref:hypothetical protein n=1 Tax=Paracoccus sp. TaxID=267 RepID=UPI0026DF71A5|nr:hypothetical protein [Paracoccus sp. (in: a-proteobacteria)]MDO5632387.1 hypothetical protein [Paracoccus sp. (in: a-proteobacteria)]